MLSGRRPTQKPGGARGAAEPARGRASADRGDAGLAPGIPAGTPAGTPVGIPAGIPIVTLAQFRAFELVDEPALLLDLAALRVRWANAAAVALWRLDAAALAAGDAPWTDPAAVVSWRQGLDGPQAGAAGEVALRHLDAAENRELACKGRLVRLVGSAPLLFLRAPGAAVDDAGARFRDFAQVSSDWFWELDRDLRFSYLSPGVEQRTGEETSGLIGRVPVREGLEAVSDEAWAAHMADLRAHRRVDDFRFARHDGTGRLRHFSVSAKPVFDGQDRFAGYRGTGRDITDLVEARQFLREVIDSLPAVIAARDRDGRYLLVNKEFANLCGTTPEAMVGKVAGTFLGPEKGRAVVEHDRAAMASGEPSPPMELTLRSLHDGRERDWLNQKVPLRDPSGAIRGVLSLGTDITQLKQTEAALRAAQQQLQEGEKRFRDFTVTASDWFWEQDAALRFTTITTGRDELDAIMPSINLGKTRRETAPLDVDDEQWARHDADLAARRPLVDFRFSRIDPTGRKRYLSVSGKPVFAPDGAFLGYRGTGRDLTALIETEQLLREREAQFRDFAEASSHWLWEMDRDGRYTYVSDSVQSVTGHPARFYLGRTMDEIDGGDYRHVPSTQALLGRLARREPFMDVVLSRTHADGRQLFLQMSGRPRFDAEGGFIGYRGTARDVTQQREAEYEAQRLRHARDLAAAADMAKSRFLAHMSHELRTPLNAILGLSEIISGQMFGPVNVPAYRDYAADINASGQHLLAIINDLLDRSRIELGQFKLSPELVDAGTLADEALRIGRGAASGAGPRIELAPSTAAAWALQVDRRAIRQVLINLLSNAAKFTPPDGRVALAVNALPSGELSFSVTDTGGGIEPERIDHVFEPFQHGNAHQARKGQGAGLGLWLSRALMELHGGSLVLQSAVGKGTRAIATLPAERVASRQSKATGA